VTGRPRVIRNNEALFSQLQELEKGDIVCCRIRMKTQEEHLLVDLVERGVCLFPSATSQLAGRSKVFQARIFQPLMIPGTCAVYDIHGLLEAISFYQRKKKERLVLKHDGKHGGLGIHLFKSPEDIFTLCNNHVIPFPFVLQPFLKNCRDIRVIILGDYLEAYQRSNPDNFRNNLHCGGKAFRCELTTTQDAICRQAMDRGSFPYAHIDLLISEDETVYLNEINLRGGIRGATITAERYKKQIDKLHEEALKHL